jgi:hypothetical protein
MQENFDVSTLRPALRDYGGRADEHGFFDANCTNYHEFFTTDSNNQGSKNGERARLGRSSTRLASNFWRCAQPDHLVLPSREEFGAGACRTTAGAAALPVCFNAFIRFRRDKERG